MKSQVAKIMKEKSFSIRGLENETGLSTRTIQNARKDETFELCNLQTLKKIANALGVSVKDLFDDDITDDPN